jgi:hypothetical protein
MSENSVRGESAQSIAMGGYTSAMAKEILHGMPFHLGSPFCAGSRAMETFVAAVTR